MSAQVVHPVLDARVRTLCTRPYHNHPNGCPNVGKKRGCPPDAKLLGDILDLSRPVWAVYNKFQFGEHCARMRDKHPGWSERQVECCLYWQGRARKQLKDMVASFMTWIESSPLCVIATPEACGVNMTATMANAGVQLEWPPRTVAYQIVLVGKPKLLEVKDE